MHSHKRVLKQVIYPDNAYAGTSKNGGVPARAPHQGGGGKFAHLDSVAVPLTCRWKMWHVAQLFHLQRLTCACSLPPFITIIKCTEPLTDSDLIDNC